MAENISKSSCYTKEFTDTKMKEKSTILKHRLMQVAIRKSQLKNEMPSWQEQTVKESNIRARVSQRLKAISFQKKIRPTLREVLKVLTTFHFMRSVSIFFDLLSLQEHELRIANQASTIAQVNRIEDLSHARNHHDSRTNLDIFLKFKVRSALRLVVNQLSLLPMENRMMARSVLIAEKAKMITNFGRFVARRRILDLCILTANFNKYVLDRYPRKSNMANLSAAQRIPVSTGVLHKSPKLLAEVRHIGFVMMQKHRSMCIEFCMKDKDPTDHALSILKSLLQELLPFSVNLADLQFDRSYYLIKKVKITEEIINLDIRSKLEAINLFLDQRNDDLKNKILEYRRNMEEYIRSNPTEISQQRLAYLYRQNVEHIEKLIKHHDFSRSSLAQDKLPYQSRKRLFMFAESLNPNVQRPRLDFGFNEEEAISLLEMYNRILKANFLRNQENQARLKKSRTRTKDKKDREGTYDSLPDD